MTKLPCFLLAVVLALATRAVALPIDTEGLSASSLDLEGVLAERPDYSRAVDALRQNNYDHALEIGKGYVQKNPTDAHAHLLLALSWVGNDELLALSNHLDELEKKLPRIAGTVKYHIAEYYASRGRYYHALDLLDEIKQDNIESQALRLKGDILIQQSRMNDAIDTLTTLYEIDNGHSDVLLWIARSSLAIENYAQAADYAARYLEHEPRSVFGLIVLGTSQIKAGRYDTARKTFLKAQDIEQDNPAVLLNLALLFQADRECKTASDYYVKLLAIEPDSSESYRGLALCAAYENNLQDVFEHTKKAYQSGRPDVAAITLAAAALRNGRGNYAGQELQKAASLFIDLKRPGFNALERLGDQPSEELLAIATANLYYAHGYPLLGLAAGKPLAGDNASVFFKVTEARSYWKSIQQQKALEVMEAAHRSNPDMAGPLIDLAGFHFHTGDIEKAIEGYELAIKTFPELTELVIQLGDLYNAADHPDDAINIYSRYLEKHPDDSYVLNQMAATYAFKKNDPDKALDYAQKAIDLTPGSVNVKDTLAYVHYQKKNYANALALYEDVKKNAQVNDPDFYYRLGEISLSVGDKEKAKRYFEHALNSGRPFDQRADADRQLRQLLRTL